MGVYGLQTFIETKVQDGCQEVNLGKIAKSSKRSNVLIIDLFNFARKPLEILDLQDVIKRDINGGDFIGYKRTWASILENFEKAGIKVIFVCDGALDFLRRRVWMERKYKQMSQDIIPMLNAIRLGHYPKSGKISRVPDPSKYRVQKLLRYELGYNDVVFTSAPHQDPDKACAAAVEKYNAFGILSSDTDFLIHQFPPEVKVFSIKHLNVETLDTVAYDRQKLAEHLGLKMEQLPLLATLKGNDFLNFKDLIHFHRNLMQAKNGNFLHLNNVFPKLADFIRRQGVDMDLKEFARKFLRNESKAGVMQESLDSYKLQSKDIDEPRGSLQIGCKSAWTDLIRSKPDYSSKVFHVMCAAPFVWGACLEDYSWRYSLPKSADVLKGPRKRLYGILFMEKPSAMNRNKSRFVDDFEIEELCMTGHESLDGPVFVKPILPPMKDHPGLNALWQDQKDREFNFDFKKSWAELDKKVHKQRWRLYSWIINPNLTDLALLLKSKCLDETDIFMVSQLYIMQHELDRPILTKKEVLSFILVNFRLKQLVQSETEEAKNFKKMPITFVPDSRPVQLATFYWRSLLDMFSDGVGDLVARRHFLPYGKFDGVLFQNIYRDLHDENNNNTVIKTRDEEIYALKVYSLVTSNGIRVAPPLSLRVYG